MEFYLTYEGPLNATQRDARDGQRSRHAENKRVMRLHFHEQLQRLWRVLPALSDEYAGGASFIIMEGAERANTIDALQRKHAMYGHNFVPLVTEELDLLCSLEILMLRPDRPGRTPWSGDIDNRLKTLLDALRIPEAGEGYGDAPPAPGTNPFFVLLEDDKLLTKVSVETDRLLSPVGSRNDDVRIFIKVSIRPYAVHPDNMHFA